MNLIARMLHMLIAVTWRSRADSLDETCVRMRVWPNDLDAFLHVNNGRYLTMMDIGRLDAFFRTGWFGICRKRGWRPVVASEMIRFRASLAPFARFELRTRLLGWDERSFYYRQTFVHRGRVAAIGIARIRFLQRGGAPLDAAELAAAVMPGTPMRPLPAYIGIWQDAEDRYSREAVPDGSAHPSAT